MPITLLTIAEFNAKFYRIEEIRTGTFFLIYFVPYCLHLNDKLSSMLRKI